MFSSQPVLQYIFWVVVSNSNTFYTITTTTATATATAAVSAVLIFLTRCICRHDSRWNTRINSIEKTRAQKLVGQPRLWPNQQGNFYKSFAAFNIWNHSPSKQTGPLKFQLYWCSNLEVVQHWVSVSSSVTEGWFVSADAISQYTPED